MPYNLADIRISKNEETQVNGQPYIDVSRAYYFSSMYSDDLGVIDGLFEGTIPVFNAVPKVVNIATALAVGNELEPCYDDSEWVQEVIDKLALEQEKIFMCRDLILGKSILVEVQSRNFDTDSEEQDDVFTSDNFPYNLAFYPSDEYEIISEGQKILYANIKGVKLKLNEEQDGYDEVEVEKIFIRKDDGTAESYILEGEEKTDEATYEDGILPLVEITTTYDMKQLFYSIDRHNELGSFIRNILYLAGEPILAGTGLDRISQQTSETVNGDRYKKLKALFTKTENAKLSMIEITGTSARVMLENQHSIVQNIIKDYPEYSISEVLSGGNVSEETTRIRLMEVLSRVNEVKRNMEIGINKIIGLVGFYEGKEMIKKYVSFGSEDGVDINKTLEAVTAALNAGLISRKSAMYQIRTLFLGEDVDEEIKAIEKEGGLTNETEQNSISTNDSTNDGAGN